MTYARPQRPAFKATRLATSIRTGTPIRFEVPSNTDVPGCPHVNGPFDKVIGSHIAERDTSLVKSFAVCVVARQQLSEAFVGRPVKRAMCQFGPRAQVRRVAVSPRHPRQFSGRGVKNLDTKVCHFGRKSCEDGIDRDVHRQGVSAVAGRTIPLRESMESGLIWIGALYWRPLHYWRPLYARPFGLWLRLRGVTG